MTTSIDTNSTFPSILTTVPEDIAFYLEQVTPEQLAAILANAPPHADLYGADVVKNFFWKTEKLAGLIGAVNVALNLLQTKDWREDSLAHSERAAMLCIIRASAYRRSVPPKFNEAKMDLGAAIAYIKEVEIGDSAWADALSSKVNYELRQILAPLGMYMEAAKLGFKEAKEQLQKAKPEEHLGILFGIWRIAEMNAVNAALKDGDAATASLSALNFLNVMDAMTPKTDVFKRIQLAFDAMRISWLTGKKQDFSEALLWIRTQMELDERLKNAYGYSVEIMTAANGAMSDDPEWWVIGFRAARMIADDPTVGNDWRADAMLAAAQTALALKRTDDAERYRQMLGDLAGYHGPAKAIAARI